MTVNITNNFFYSAANVSISYAQTLLFCHNLTKYKNSIHVSSHYVDNPHFASDPGTLATTEYLTTPFRNCYWHNDTICDWKSLWCCLLNLLWLGVELPGQVSHSSAEFECHWLSWDWVLEWRRVGLAGCYCSVGMMWEWSDPPPPSWRCWLCSPANQNVHHTVIHVILFC